MIRNASSQAYRINIDTPVYAVMNTDTKTGCTYGAVKDLGEAMQIQIAPVIANGALYGNGAKVEDISKIMGYDVTVDNTKIPIEDRAIMSGHKYNNGVMVVAEGDQPPNIAFGYRTEQTNGKYEYTWLLKGRAQPPAKTDKQSENNIQFSTDSMKISFVKRIFDKAFEILADTANPDFTESAASVFLNAVPTDSLTPAVQEYVETAKYTQSQLEAMDIAKIKAIAVIRGYTTVTSDTKSTAITEFLAAQNA